MTLLATRRFIRSASATGLALMLCAGVSHIALAQSVYQDPGKVGDVASWKTPEYLADWGLDSMHAASAYAAGFTGQGVIVGVVDSGVYISNPEFTDGRVRPLTISGVFGSNGFYFENSDGSPSNKAPLPSFFSTGQPFTVPGIYDSAYNDVHGTHVVGSIAAGRNGFGMHGVAFNADVYVANTHSTDATIYGPNQDYTYLLTAYGAVAAAGARVINSSWGSPPPIDSYNSLLGMVQAYAAFDGKKTYLDALSDVTYQYGAIQVFAAGNTATTNPNIRSSLPYFRADLERNWLVVGSYSQGASGSGDPQNVVLSSFTNEAGIDKYWYITAPGGNIVSTSIPGVGSGGYTTLSGTSMSAPHATGALAVIMQRYGYMTNEQARDVLLTTAFHRDAVTGTPDANQDAPNSVWGWGIIDLNKAMNGPGQFLGSSTITMPTGVTDTWTNNISEGALIQRTQENQEETAAWPTRKAALAQQLTADGIASSIPIVVKTLNDLQSGLLSAGNYQSAIDAAWRAADDNLILSAILTKLTLSNPYWSNIGTPLSRIFAAITLSNQILALTAADYAAAGVTASSLWQQYVAIEEARIASFALMPTQGSLIKAGGGLLTLAGTNTFSGGVTLAGGTLSVSREVNLGALSGGLTFDGGILQITGTDFTSTARSINWAPRGGGFDVADPANTFTLSQSLSGSGQLAKLGAGTLALAGANTYTGPTLINAGTLEAHGGSAIGDLSSVTVEAGAALDLRDNETVGSLAGAGRVNLGSSRLNTGGNGASTIFSGSVSGTGGLDKAGAGTLTITGTNTYTGGTAILAGTLQIGDGTTIGSIVGDVVTNGTLAFNRADAITFAGTISGSGELRQSGSGTLTLTAASTYTGLTTIAAGTLALTPGSSLVSPVLTLAGAELINGGTLTGGVVNAGTTTSFGLIAGGVTNTGTFTASAGQINGAIRNLGGTFAVTGSVSSDATFANTTGSALTVNGSYSLSGRLINAGTLNVASGGSLTAEAIDNTGTLTVSTNSSVIDSLNNFGLVRNDGIYFADATNYSGALLINSGIFTTQSHQLVNFGTVITEGVLNGGLMNSGTVQASGQINGAVDNTGSVQLTGPITGITRLTNDGAFNLGGTALAVGSLAGITASATLGNGQLTAGADGSSTIYAGRIVDGAVATSLVKVGDGTLTLAGDSYFTGPMNVLGGGVSVTGMLRGTFASFGAGTILSGQGGLENLSLRTGSTIAPGIAPGVIGQISVSGNLSFAPGSTYQLDATADGHSDRILVGGHATLEGGAVRAVAGTGQYAPRTRYTILSAIGGLTGQFAGVSTNFAFLTPFLGYDRSSVYLTLARNDLDFAAVARTANQRAAAEAVQAGAVGSPLYDAVATLSAPQAQAAFAALSGDAYASLASTAFATAGLLREVVLDRLRWDDTLSASAETRTNWHPATYAAIPASQTGSVATAFSQVTNPQTFGIWGQGFGSAGQASTDGNAAALSRTTGGFILGADMRLDGALRLGMAGGYRTTSFATPGSAEAGTVDGAFGGVYGQYGVGPVSVRFGALAADDGVSLRRLTLFPGFAGTPSTRTGGTTVQGFGEAGYKLVLGQGLDDAEQRWSTTLLEPFAGGAVVMIQRNRFTEQGGAAALGGVGQEETLPVSTIGIRSQMTFNLEAGLQILARGILGYRHAFGDVTPTTHLTVLGTGANFISAGLPIDRNALIVESGLSVRIAEDTAIGLSYMGQIGSRAQDHATKGELVYRF